MSAKKAFPLRLDPALHDAVQRLADAELRSVNAEIEVLLREALVRRGIAVARPEPARRGRPPAADHSGDST
ncbi:MAG: Arc family DNA-binding protein [Erythrobacter sp.]|uniref:Arc family DNA-binding protein n=1 Tax=Erythrobacter sp. TaxID=1042 RepID=UPI0025FA9ED1|nr:Arc family DNA-binding protein [Erythrobacter sp.]MCL9999313.1 Arc family DNA-binding protein [Erythrobacter sp.]